MVTIEEFKDIVQELFVCPFVESETEIKFEIHEKEFVLNKESFGRLVENLTSKTSDGETILYDQNYFEVLTRSEGFLSIRGIRGESVVKEDTQNSIKYEYYKCSDEYLLFILSKIKELGMLTELRRYRRGRHLVERLETSDILEMIKFTFPRFDTLRIASRNVRTKNDYEKLANAFVFQIGFNLDFAIIELRYLEEFFRTDRLYRVRRTDLAEIEAPKRRYIVELVYHYQMAISTDSPMLQFISYYHIMEHFFEKVYNDDLVKVIEREITNPQFSSKREGDLKKLITTISKKLKARGESFAFNEQEALQLTLNKYIDLDELVNKITEYNSELVLFYKNNPVGFSLFSPLENLDTTCIF